MFQAGRKHMPARDYVSIVSSLFEERVSLVIGTLVTTAAVLTVYMHSRAPVMLWLAGAFVFSGVARYVLSVLFKRSRIDPDDVNRAAFWELIGTIQVVGTALIYGVWCFVSLVFVADPYAQLTCSIVSIAVLIGLTTRSFALDRIVTLSSIAVAVPLAGGLFLEGNIYYAAIGVLLAPYLFSIRSLAGKVRRIFLAAVHGRQEATRLAAELDAAVTTMSHGLCLLEEDLRVSVANDRVVELLIGAPSAIVRRNFMDVVSLAAQEGNLTKLSAERLKTAVADRKSCKLVLQLSDGTQTEVSISTRGEQIALVFEDITERVATENKIKYLARYDDLTSLPNRRHFSEQAESRLARIAAEGAGTPVMLMIVDLDDFKHINDSMGHPVGDVVLKRLAGRMRQCLDSHVLLGRFGGDEFTVFDDRHVTPQRAEAAAARLLTSLRQPLHIEGELIELHASVGYVIAEEVEPQYEMLLKRADLALYAAKGAGKNQWMQFHPRMDREYYDRQQLRAALKEALRNNELSLAYQPIIAVETGRVVACEALARWHHPEYGIIPPSIFIPVAEEIGAVSELTDWVLHTASRECVQWPEDVAVSVNISARDFKGDAVQRMVRSALHASGLVPGRLEIEVTETVLMQELDTASHSMQELRAMGVGIALDDFGTGYSSLAYVHDMPFTKLKVDRAFTTDVTSDVRSLKLLRNIAHMSKELDMVVTVEGVETEEQFAAIAEIGLIDHVQGFLMGAPVPGTQVNELISRIRPLERGNARSSARQVRGS